MNPHIYKNKLLFRVYQIEISFRIILNKDENHFIPNFHRQILKIQMHLQRFLLNEIETHVTNKAPCDRCSV